MKSIETVQSVKPSAQILPETWCNLRCEHGIYGDACQRRAECCAYNNQVAAAKQVPINWYH